jgi:hypothetical protein
VVPASAPGFFCSNLVSSSEAVYIYIMTVYLYLIISCVCAMTSSKKSKASAFGEPTLKQTYKKH